MRTPMFDTLRILTTHTVVALMSALGVIGCQGQRANLSADIEPLVAAVVQAEAPAGAMSEASDDLPPRPAEGGSRTPMPGDETDAGTLPAINPGGHFTRPGASALRTLPRQNPHAEDLLDHWGHRNVETIPGQIGLTSIDDEGTTLQALRSAAASASTETVAPDLAEGDTVEVLGERLGIRYGRWTGGPADTLSIEFDFENVSEEIREDPAFRALFERAGKAWSHRISDTWSTYPLPQGTTSTGLGINVFVRSVPSGYAGLGGFAQISPGERFEPHTGSITLDTEKYQVASEQRRLAVVSHELGHALGAWRGLQPETRHTRYTDQENGTWTGPEVVAIHGRPAPFQNRANPSESINGERDPEATQIDYAHSGVCTSIMAYCRGSTSILPHPIDYAFLADLGMTIIEPTDRPETYGFGMWTDHAGANVSVARTFRVETTFDDALNFQTRMDIIDLLEARVDAFGYRSAGDPWLSHGARTSSGTARFAGGLFGTALELEGLPPVIGGASLEVDLDVLRGDAYFTSLEVFEHGIGTQFGTGALHHPFEVSGNMLVGTRPGTSLRADFYGPQHQEIAGNLHDPFAGLLAGFAATTDNRPAHQDHHREHRLRCRTRYSMGFRRRDGKRVKRVSMHWGIELQFAEPAEWESLGFLEYYSASGGA